MTRSKSNRFNKNKTKRYRQTKNKRRRQTKNKRRRQHGGEVKKYLYTRDSQTILKTGSVTNSVTNSVLIPGYSEIMDMMKEYETDESEKLNQSIKQKDVQLIRECSLPSSIEEGKIIVLRKEDKKILGFQVHNASIDCDPNQYYTLASYNFKIFIEDILGWNPFLNLPNRPKKIEMNQLYGSSPHVYESEPVFKTNDWWNGQPWWLVYKRTEPFKTAVDAAAREATAAARESTAEAAAPAVDLSSILGQPQPLNTQLSSVTNLINNNLKLTISSLQKLVSNSREKHKYIDINDNMTNLASNVQKLVIINDKINIPPSRPR